MMKILHVGLGPLGIRFVRDYAQRGVAEPIGAVDVLPELAGRPLKKLVKGAAFSTKIVNNLDDFDAWDAVDCAVVTTSSGLDACAETFRALLARGLAVVSTCEELTWPYLRHPELSRELHAMALAHGGRLLGTGVNPGFMMDALPVFATTVCRNVESIEIHRVQDASTRRIPFQRKIGATLDRRAFAAGIREGWLRHVGLGESMHLVAAAMGWKIDRWNETITPVIAARGMSCGLGRIRKGDAAGVRQVANGFARGKRVLRFVFQAAIGQKDPEDRVIVRGEPDVDLVLNGGVHGDIGTSSITINAIPSLLAAPAGLHTMLSIPLTHFVRA
ncbi:MAG: hypothetical protein AB7K52_01615 [Phycisphaerales bacterium]